MANRIAGTVFIIDSGSNAALSNWPPNAKVMTVAFWSTDTTGVLRIATSNTSNCIMHLQNGLNVPNTVGAHIGGVYFTDNMTVPTLVNGTAWIYMV